MAQNMSLSVPTVGEQALSYRTVAVMGTVSWITLLVYIAKRPFMRPAFVLELVYSRWRVDICIRRADTCVVAKCFLANSCAHS